MYALIIGCCSTDCVSEVRLKSGTSGRGLITYLQQNAERMAALLAALLINSDALRVTLMNPSPDVISCRKKPACAQIAACIEQLLYALKECRAIKRAKKENAAKSRANGQKRRAAIQHCIMSRRHPVAGRNCRRCELDARHVRDRNHDYSLWVARGTAVDQRCRCRRGRHAG